MHVPALEQIALCELLASGGYERHVRRMRARYRGRRDRLLALLAERAPALVPVGISAGLGVLLELPGGGPTSAELSPRRSSRSIELHPLPPYYAGGRGAARRRRDRLRRAARARLRGGRSRALGDLLAATIRR